MSVAKKQKHANHPKHPAKYSDSLLPQIAEWLSGYPLVLDPFGGTGKIGHVKQHGFTGQVISNDLEIEWAEQALDNGCDGYFVLDATDLVVFDDSSIPAIATSPTYGSRMADHHRAKDTSKRLTYTHLIERDLSVNNTGKMHFGSHDYCNLHWLAYLEFRRVLQPNGILILNMSNFIKADQEVFVSEWHVSILEKLGFKLLEHKQIETPRMRFGKNHEKRITHENLYLFENIK